MHPYCWLVFLHVSPQPIRQAHPVFQKNCLLQLCIFSLQQPQTSLENSLQTPPLLILLTTTHHFWHFTSRQLCFFSQSKYPNSVSLTANPTASSRTHLLLLLLPLIYQFSLLRNPTSTRSFRTIQTCNLIQILSPPALSKNVHPYSSLQSPTLSTYLLFPAIFIPFSSNLSSLHNWRYPLWIKTNSATTGQSRIFLICKIIECVVKSHLIDHFTSNSLLNSHQSAYCRHHSTETALLYIHDHLISAVGSQKVSCLCLLDLSAAFDTVDHDILITRLSSWFGIRGSVLSWLKSYLSPCFLCQMWNQPVFLVHILLRCPPRLCSWSFTLPYVHHSC